MGTTAAFYIALFATLALVIGKHFNRFLGASSDLKTRRAQVPILRDIRDRAFSTVILVAVIFAAVLYVIARKHHG